MPIIIRNEGKYYRHTETDVHVVNVRVSNETCSQLDLSEEEIFHYHLLKYDVYLIEKQMEKCSCFSIRKGYTEIYNDDKIKPLFLQFKIYSHIYVGFPNEFPTKNSTQQPNKQTIISNRWLKPIYCYHLLL